MVLLQFMISSGYLRSASIFGAGLLPLASEISALCVASLCILVWLLSTAGHFDAKSGKLMKARQKLQTEEVRSVGVPSHLKRFHQGYTLSKILKVCFHMVLSYARGSWRFKVASLVASSVAVAVRYGNVGGSFSGNEELVASLMAECDGKNEGKRIWVAKGVATLHGKN